MRKRASRRPERINVGGQVAQVALSPSGRIFTLTTEGKLGCIEISGRPIWERKWRVTDHRSLTLRVSDDGRPWVGLGDLLIEIDHDGSELKTQDLVRDDQERLGSFLLAPDGFYACLYRPGAPGTSGPRVMKLGPSGSALWSTTLPIGAIGYTGVVEAGVRTGWDIMPKQPWQPETWEPIRYGGSEPLLLSGDRLLVSFYEFPRSGIGSSYGLDAETGDLLWVTEPAPTSTLAVAGPGRFYHGLQGYGAFETRLLDHDGSVQRRWESHGYLVIDEQGRVRSLEMENRLPSRMRFVTLQDDGGVSNGPLLDGYYSSYPAISREGVVAFWRNGELVLIDDTMTKEIIYSDPLAAEQGVIGRMLLSPGGSLVFSVGHEVWILGEGLGSLAETPWPCGGGNARNNPVWL